jgi:hypothetical protein
MKWIAISGSWRNTNAQVEKDVREAVSAIMRREDGVVTGGAPGVDYFAVDEALKQDTKASRIKIILPTTLKFYLHHTQLRIEEGMLAKNIGEPVIHQLNDINKTNPISIIEGKDIPGKIHVEQWQYFERDGLIVAAADELIAFSVNNSEGTADTIEKARKKGIPVKVNTYTIPQ